jgi:hypothetical protein
VRGSGAGGDVERSRRVLRAEVGVGVGVGAGAIAAAMTADASGIARKQLLRLQNCITLGIFHKSAGAEGRECCLRSVRCNTDDAYAKSWQRPNLTLPQSTVLSVQLRSSCRRGTSRGLASESPCWTGRRTPDSRGAAVSKLLSAPLLRRSTRNASNGPLCAVAIDLTLIQPRARSTPVGLSAPWPNDVAECVEKAQHLLGPRALIHPRSAHLASSLWISGVAGGS